ncbi:response regulator transcription factor [Flaviaesturariibacter flavus]|uniref:Response regulator transcription factor n=1 Tax=Flaviaesturariibacter flavus TaxID=2502780 RepID=A0A4R1BC25_9BACT|nr:response regulator transcription factor [Flaviaesturariibacter flavus]TCJ14544.1 response regulator transcription factor [Flaviaesturariibacter flavus]
MNVLIVEDEQELSRSICDYLTQERFACVQAYDYPAALQRLEERTFDCVLLDVSLPGGSGLAVLQHLKAEKRSDGVLVISAKGLLQDRLQGLKLGADDYLVKPFHLAEMAARVEAIIRRKAHDGQKQLEFGMLQIDLDAHLVMVGEKKVDLTRKEYELLLYLISNKNRVINKNALAIHLWGDQADLVGSYDYIYTHIKNLRRKLEAAGAPDYVKSVYGIGYKCSLP